MLGAEGSGGGHSIKSVVLIWLVGLVSGSRLKVPLSFYLVLKWLGALSKLLLCFSAGGPPVAGLVPFDPSTPSSLYLCQQIGKCFFFSSSNKAPRSAVAQGLLFVPSWWERWFLHRGFCNLWCSLLNCQRPVFVAHRAPPSQCCQSSPSAHHRPAQTTASPSFCWLAKDGGLMSCRCLLVQFMHWWKLGRAADAWLNKLDDALSEVVPQL